jgi:hypothetical protein
MSLRDSFTGSVGQDDALLQPIPAGLVAYRLVQSAISADSDFTSHYERRLKPDPTKAYLSYEWFGVSLYLKPAKLNWHVRTARRKGGDPYIAELQFGPGSGLYGIYKPKTTHLEAFGTPQALRALEVRVYKP